VEKVWRAVRWAESFPDESLTMNAVDLTPTFALRKLAVLFDGGKVSLHLNFFVYSGNYRVRKVRTFSKVEIGKIKHETGGDWS
jgi:hypothetical protein